MTTVDTSRMININDLASSRLEHVDELVALSNRAKAFLESHPWCKRIVRGMFDRGWGYIIAVFYFTIEPAHDDVPNHVWVIVGDLPPAYIDVESNPNGACAIDGYVLEMQRWVDQVLEGRSVAERIPVNVPPTKEWAERLQGRLQIIREEVLAPHDEEIRSGLDKSAEND